MSKNIVYIIIVVMFLLGYLRYFEYRSLYFPMEEMEYTPADIGLSYSDEYVMTDDGMKLNAWLIPAKDSRFTLLFCHGNGGNISHRIDKIEILNSLGLDVFIFDYRGYGSSTGRPSEKGLYKDVEAVYEYLISEKKISPDRIILYGESLGGAVATHLALQRPVRALITESAFTSTPDMARELYPIFPAFFISSKFNILAKIKDVSVPKLIMHSKNDEIVPFGHSVKLFNASSGGKTHLVLRGSHNNCYQDSEDIYSSGIQEFLKRL